MRISGVVSFLVASLCLAGCSSTAGVDALDLQKPSNETTSSVIRPPRADRRCSGGNGHGRRGPKWRQCLTTPPDDNAPPFGLAEEETVAFRGRA